MPAVERGINMWMPSYVTISDANGIIDSYPVFDLHVEGYTGPQVDANDDIYGVD